MTDRVQKIREEVVGIINGINLFTPDEDGKNSSYEAGKLDVATKILQIIDSSQEEPVSEEFEKALAEEWKGYIERGAATVDALEDNTQELAFAKGFYLGSKWQKANDESVTQDLGEYINELSKQFPEVSFAKLSRISVRVAKWQEEQLTKNAIEATVKVDAGGYPYIPQIELYDYNKDAPLAKEGDKYKVVLIKEE